MADGGKVVIKIDGDPKGFKSAMGGISKIAGVAFKGIAVGAAAATTAIGAIGAAAVKSYSEFEQLSGGAQKIFDEIDYAQIKKDADEAFKTMQISANQYLQLMTTVGANFASTLGDAKGYEVAKQGMQAITDFATGTGRSIDELSEKYQMITKSTSSYQSIADQFAGVLPATSAEFLKQAQAAGILGDSYTKLTDVPMAEYQEAVTQMIAKGVDALGLTDNAANEAATTLSGSFNMLKASWDNLMTGLADPSQNLEALVQNVVDSANALLSNLLPVISNILPSIASAISALLPQVVDAITTILPQILPVIIDGVAQLGIALADAIPVIIDVLVDSLPLLIDASLQIILALANGLTNSLPELIPSVVEAVITIVETLIDNIDLLIDASIEIIMALADGLIKSLPLLIEKMPEIIIKICDALVENSPMLVMAALELIIMLGIGLIKAIPTLVKNIPKIIEAMHKAFTVGFSTMNNIGKHLVEGIWNGIIKAKDWLLNKIKSFAKTITQGIKDFFGIKSPSRVFRDEVGLMLTKGLAIGIDKGSTEVEKAMNSMNETLLESELKYQEELARIEKEKYEKEKKQKFAEAKNAKEREKIKQEYIAQEQEEANQKYLEQLKETADQERKIYEALQKDIENWQKSAVNSLTELAEQAFDKIDDVAKLQETFSNKLKNYGELFTITEKNIYGKNYEVIKIEDAKKQTKALEDYANALLDIKAKSNVPKEFFTVLRDLSVEEGTKFAKQLLKMDEDSFNEYILDWQNKQAKADELSKILYADEAENAKNEIKKSFEKFDEDLEVQGKQNAEAWGTAFYKKIKEQIPGILDTINKAFGDIVQTPTYAFAGVEVSKPITNAVEQYKERVLHNQIILNDRVIGENIVTLGNQAAERTGTSFYVAK